MENYKRKFKESNSLHAKDVKIGMYGTDYNAEIGIVVATGPYEKLKKYDNDPSSTEEQFGSSLHSTWSVLVVNEHSLRAGPIFYIYDESGFTCKNDEINKMISLSKLSSRYQKE